MLNNVVNKYCTDEDTRKSMMSAWHKMINNGHLLFLDDLSLEQRDSLIHSKYHTGYLGTSNLRTV